MYTPYVMPKFHVVRTSGISQTWLHFRANAAAHPISLNPPQQGYRTEPQVPMIVWAAGSKPKNLSMWSCDQLFLIWIPTHRQLLMSCSGVDRCSWMLTCWVRWQNKQESLHNRTRINQCSGVDRCSWMLTCWVRWQNKQESLHNRTRINQCKSKQEFLR